MYKERYRVRQLECCNTQMFGDLIVTCPTYTRQMPKKLIQPVPITVKPVFTPEEIVRKHMMEAEKRRASLLVDQLLLDIHNSIQHQHTTDYNSTTSERSSQKYSRAVSQDLWKRDIDDLSALVVLLGGQIERVGVKLVRRLKRRENLRRQQEAHCDVITCQLKQLLPNSPEEMCFTVNPQAGESGFSQWVTAMKMVAQLPGGIPPEFRKRLWLTMAEKHLASKGVDWSRVERTCFSEWAHPEDGELGVQIVKDLHRTGCSLFCGEGGQENQALLKKVLLAYARWNKAVGYCQGFNMLAALILQVTDRSETDALKLMIYLIEGVLPDSYFADSLRGLSVDMAVFRELLRTRLPRLSKHLDLLQNLAKEGTTSYEPPLTNVFTMQWFLTLFCNCLPQPSVLRIWDLILLEGNEILLRTALAIWQTLAEKIVRVRTADEFYCIMGLLTTELLENNLIDANSLIKAVVSIGPLTELRSLREHYLYNINPLGPIPNLGIAEKQLKVYPKERINLDISTLKKQYMKLRQRQRQAHIIFSAAINRQPPPKAPVAMNHLLLGKSALVPAKRLGPPKGSIPPARVPTTLHWKDTKQTSSSSSSDTELCDDDNPPSDSSDDINHKSPVPDLPEDNPYSSDTQNVEDDVQESPPSVVTKDNVENQQGDILESLVNSEFVVRKITDEDSEDDSVDFELFLEDRVKSLKQDGDNKRVTLSRRNSERALQIIQENSLILHRILQCQSRLSLSPPATETCNDSDDESASKKSQSSGISMNPTFHLEATTQDTKEENQTPNSKTKIHPDTSDYDLPKTPKDVDEYPFPSKYEEILKKSRNLNEKCDGIFNTGTKKAAELEDQEIQLPESKTFTNQEELIDLTTNCDQNEKKKSYILSEFDVNYSENKIRPWLEKIDLNRNTEYLQSFDDDLAPQQNTTHTFKPFRDDTSEKDEETKTDQSGPVIPDMIVSFSESRKNSEKEPCSSLRDEDYDWSKKILFDGKKTSEADDNLASSDCGYTSLLESQNFSIRVDKIGERKSLSATNSIEKTDQSNERRSLSATNSIERATDDVCLKVRRTVKSPDISYESSILSPPRSRLSSSNSRDLMSPMNESSMSISSRVTSPSPEREFESYRRLSPRRPYSTTNEDTRVSHHEEAVIMRTKSPQRNFDTIEDPRNSWEYKNYRESKDRIEKKLYGDSERRLKDLPSSTDNIESSSKGSTASIEESLTKTPDAPKDYSLEHRSSSFSSKSSSLPDQQWKKKNLKLFDGKYDSGEDHSEYGASRSSKLSSPDRGSYSSRSSPLLRYEERRDCTSPKSPNRVFNPFPVPLSSRQNKEIGVKLGLYKK